jgi:tRNA 5-methylaminomethyl-2-thiouridine biosynthesis bifunctional protein
MTEAITHAQLVWGEDGLPRSAAFGDVYFSAHDPLEETRYVFLDANNLSARFEQAQGQFTIAETGFGSGLNFLSAWALWDAQVPRERDASLHFISCEKYPLSLPDLQRIHTHFPTLARYCEALQASYPLATAGVHRVVCDGGRVRLTLFFGDIAQMPDALRMEKTLVDAWFLDGFAPQKNPLMWQDAFFHWMRRVSAADASVATFTAAGAVKRGLMAAGFTVEKKKGYGFKRDMLVAHCSQDAHTCDNPLPIVAQRDGSRKRSAVVIGGGIAGTSAAYALARRGLEVTQIERHAAVGCEASGNPVGVLFPLLNKTWSPQVRFYAAGFHYARQLLAHLKETQGFNAFDHCGMIQLAKGGDAEARSRLMALPASLQLDEAMAHTAEAAWLSEKAGIEIATDGVFFPHGTWVGVPQLGAQLVRHPLIRCVMEQTALSLEAHGQRWRVMSDGALPMIEADVVVLANALDAVRMLPDVTLPLRTIQGQVSYIPATAQSQALKTILCFGGYISPSVGGMHCAGATYDHHRTDCQADAAGHRRNLDDIHAHVPALGFAQSVNSDTLQGRAALRVVSRDRLPVIGEVAQCGGGVYVSVAHASRGLISAPLAAEWLASAIMGDVLPVTHDVSRVLSPSRFQ